MRAQGRIGVVGSIITVIVKHATSKPIEVTCGTRCSDNVSRPGHSPATRAVRAARQTCSARSSGRRPRDSSAQHIELEEHELAFTAASADHFLDINSRHPLAVAAVGIFEQAGRAEQARLHLLAILQAGNEDPTAFRTTSRYVVARAA